MAWRGLVKRLLGDLYDLLRAKVVLGLNTCRRVEVKDLVGDRLKCYKNISTLPMVNYQDKIT